MESGGVLKRRIVVAAARKPLAFRRKKVKSFGDLLPGIGWVDHDIDRSSLGCNVRV